MPKIHKKTKQEKLDEIFERLGKPSNGLDVNILKTRLDNLVKYYNYCIENAKSETNWNDDRDQIERISKKSSELREAIEGASQGVLSRMNTALQLLSDETERNPLKHNTLIYPGSEDLEILKTIEKVCSTSIELFGGKHQCRPKATGIKARIVCCIAHWFHEFYIINCRSNIAPRISTYARSPFFELVKELLPDDFDVTYSIRKAKTEYKKYLGGETEWWIRNVEIMSNNSEHFDACLEFGIVPVGEKDVGLVYSHEKKILEIEIL